MENNWGKIQAAIISNLCDGLSKNHIRYFILRNYERLPEYNNGNDVDIVIEPNKYYEVEQLLIKVLRKEGVYRYDISQYDRMRCLYIMDPDIFFSLHIDIIENEMYKGFEFFDFDELYANTIIHKSFTVLNKTYDTIMLLAQNLVAYKSLKPKYQEIITNNYQEKIEDINTLILIFFGKNIGGFIVENLQKMNFQNIINHAYEIEKKTMKRIFHKRPFYTTKNVIRFLIGKFYRIICCPKRFQRFIAVEAPDGTGKTTFIEGLQDAINYYYVSKGERCHIYHHRPMILPNLGAIREKVGFKEQDKNFTIPHRAEPVGFFNSLFRMTYYWLDYFIGIPYLLRKDVQYTTYTIFDRYIYDFLIDPHRTRINLPYWLRNFFTKLVIHPRIVFILLTDAKTIYNRKQELTIEEIDRQLSGFSKLAKTDKRFVIIDATYSPEKMVKQAMETIIKRFTQSVD
jgi:thymidylate kinase